MIVRRSDFADVLEELSSYSVLSLDCESDGLRPYHGSRLFSIIIGVSNERAYYFNFQQYAELEDSYILPREWLLRFKALFSDADRLWYIAKFNFDLHILGVEELEIAGEVHCTQNQGRVEYNEHNSYSLEDSLERIGLKKDDKVKKWILDNAAWEWETIPGKNKRNKNLHYYKVPFDIIAPYGLDDAKGCFALGEYERTSISAQDKEYPAGVPNLSFASAIERRLTKTIYRMEKRGVKIDRPYCVRAARFEADREEQGKAAFKRETGRDFLASGKLFQTIFESERSKWIYTDKGNPSYESEVLSSFSNPAAKMVLEIRDAKSKRDFYNGFLWHADRDDVIHAQFNPGGTRTHRFSSSEPNMQNLKKDEGDALDQEFVVRRAIIPRPGHIFIMPDCDQVEYKLFLDYAKHMMILEFERKKLAWKDEFFDVANKVRDGFDVHVATAEVLAQALSREFSRSSAKTVNFGLLYGQGKGLLSTNLGVTEDEAVSIKAAYFRKIPEVQFMMNSIMKVIRERGWVRNWAGYRYMFPNREYAYTGPNTVIQGGCAAVIKVAMNQIDELFLGMKSRLVLSVHDELPCEIHESEIATAPRLVQSIMENVYPHWHIPLTVGMEWSDKSLADKKEGFPA